MDNLNEPVFLIHNYIMIHREIWRKLFEDIGPIKVYAWIQNMQGNKSSNGIFIVIAKYVA